ncbi:MAG: glycosyltransferase family 4 protein [Pseudomonadota bacterium]
MKVLIVNNMAPFVWGGAEELAMHLQRNLIIAGHESEILRIPFQWEPATRIPNQMLMVRAFELWNVDHVIALKFPAYLIRHPRKTLWLLHQYRQAYDLFEAGQTNLPAGQAGLEMQALIKGADQECFAEARQIFTNSEVTRQRLLKYNGFQASVLPPPVNDPALFPGGEDGGYIFAGGRINGMKRQHLLLDALLTTDKRVKLLIAGPPDSPADEALIREKVERHGLADRVRLDLRFLPREVYANYINQASAVAYLPFDEDSLGYVAMEAATAAKPIITTTDSGGILGLVEHEVTGWVAHPDPEGLASCLSAVVAQPVRRSILGRQAREHWVNMKINWPDTVDALLK